jgi:hypothetical protein
MLSAQSIVSQAVKGLFRSRSWFRAPPYSALGHSRTMEASRNIRSIWSYRLGPAHNARPGHIVNRSRHIPRRRFLCRATRARRRRTSCFCPAAALLTSALFVPSHLSRIIGILRMCHDLHLLEKCLAEIDPKLQDHIQRYYTLLDIHSNHATRMPLHSKNYT